jgi:hypothetical protein
VVTTRLNHSTKHFARLFVWQCSSCPEGPLECPLCAPGAREGCRLATCWKWMFAPVKTSKIQQRSSKTRALNCALRPWRIQMVLWSHEPPQGPTYVGLSVSWLVSSHGQGKKKKKERPSSFQRTKGCDLCSASVPIRLQRVPDPCYLLEPTCSRGISDAKSEFHLYPSFKVAQYRHAPHLSKPSQRKATDVL